MGNAPDPYWLAWAAGIIDGEGCISIAHLRYRDGRWRRDTYALKVEVTNTDRRMPAKLQDIFGGTVRSKDCRSRKANWRPAWRWTVCAASAERCLRFVRPWLVTKAEQADVAFRYRDLVPPRGGRVRNQRVQEAAPRLRAELASLKRVVGEPPTRAVDREDSRQYGFDLAERVAAEYAAGQTA